MILHSKHPTDVTTLEPGWHEGFLKDAHMEFGFKFDRLGANPITTSIEIEGNRPNPTTAPDNVLALARLCEDDYRSQRLVPEDVSTNHLFNIRTGTENQSSGLNIFATRVVELAQYILCRQNVKSPTIFTNKQLTHLDNLRSDEDALIYLGSTSNGTLSWEQRFVVPNLRTTRFSEVGVGLILSWQAITKPSRIPDNTLVRAKLCNFVHAKPRIKRRDQLDRVWFRDAIST